MDPGWPRGGTVRAPSIPPRPRSADRDGSGLRCGWEPRRSGEGPREWRHAAGAAVGVLRARRASEVAAVRAMGVSSQSCGATFLGPGDAVPRPAIS